MYFYPQKLMHPWFNALVPELKNIILKSREGYGRNYFDLLLNYMQLFNFLKSTYKFLDIVWKLGLII